MEWWEALGRRLWVNRKQRAAQQQALGEHSQQVGCLWRCGLSVPARSFLSELRFHILKSARSTLPCPALPSLAWQEGERSSSESDSHTAVSGKESALSLPLFSCSQPETPLTGPNQG